MSRLDLDEDCQQLRILLPPIKRLPPNPHLYLEPDDEILARALASPSETGQIDSELSLEPIILKGLRHRLLASDQRSFLTGSAVPDLQAAHIINAVRRNVTRKEEVENLLTQQRLQPPAMSKFGLDRVNNAILLESSLHTQWDIYGTFCFVPAENDAIAMLNTLRKSNERWSHMDPELDPTRPLDVTKQPFNSPLWDIIVLYPHAMLPDGQPLYIAQNRTFYVKGQPPAESNITWTSWIASGDCLSSNSPSSEPLAPFVALDVRAELGFPNISSLAMVINAHCKLGPFMQDHSGSATPRVRKFAELISDLIYEIFFVPEGLDNVVSFLRVPQDGSSMTGIISSQTQAVEQTSGAGYQFEGDEFMDAPEAPEASDTDGLTDSEFNLVSAKAHDPHLNKKERADAAMMMLFGTRRYVDPYQDRLQALYD